MYSANRFPVMLYEGGPVGYAEGGLHDEALAVRKAGRNGDSRLVHVNDDEFAEMVAEYGEPTINPETGMPEFFLGKLGKILKAVVPIALNFIPGVGPLASAAVGAALGATGGGGIKGALLGGALGGLGAGGAGGVGAKLGTSVLGKAVSPRLAQALGSAALGAGTSAALGGNPLTGALSVGLGNYLRNPMAKVTPGAPTPSDIKVTSAAPATMSASTAPSLTGSGSMAGPIPSFSSTQLPSMTPSLSGSPLSSMTSYSPSLQLTPSVTSNALRLPGMPSYDFNLPSSTQAGVDAMSRLAVNPSTQAAMDTAAAAAPAAAAKPSFWDKDFLGLGIAKNKYAVPAVIGAAALADALKPKGDTGEMTQEQFFGPSFNAKSPGSFKLASIASGELPESAAAEYAKRYFSGFAVGGDVGEGRSGRSSFAVSGPGDGRSDDIPAMLSDGEYVIDAETVALLGNGSPKAGAKKLDDLRVKIRKHKGKKLAKGKFSHNAKSADKYMAGGRI